MCVLVWNMHTLIAINTHTHITVLFLPKMKRLEQNYKETLIILGT